MRRRRLELAPRRSMSASSKAAMQASIFPASFVICAAREDGVARFLTSSQRGPDLLDVNRSCLHSTRRNDGEANVTDKRCTRRPHKPFLLMRSLRSIWRRTKSKHKGNLHVQHAMRGGSGWVE